MIELRDISIRLGEFALHEICVRVEEGEYFVILGPTGSGKTVLVECIVGLHTPAAGFISLDGRDVTGTRPEDRRVAYVPQDYCLFPHMTIRQNIAFGMRLRHASPRDTKQKVEGLAELLHIEGLLARRPLTLSGGEKQRAALARALAIDPRVLLLDEPLAAVDERTRERLCDELKHVQRELGTTTIHVSHNFEETLAVADKIGVFRDGRIVQVGTPDDVFRRPVDEFVAAFTGSQNIIDGAIALESGRPVFTSGGIRLEVEGRPAPRAKLVIRPEEITLHASGQTTGGVEGRVRRLIDKGALVKVLVEAGGHDLVVLVSKQEARRLALEVSETVMVVLPSESAHVLYAESEEGSVEEH